MKSKIVLEAAKFLYAMLLTAGTLLLLSLFLDLFIFIFLGGWNEFAGSWPCTSGTLNSAVYAPFFSVLALLAGFGGMARMMMGKTTPSLLKSLDPEAES